MLDISKLCGGKPSIPDSRDFKFKDLIGGATFIPEFTNTSHEVMRNQGFSSMCGGFAGSSYKYSQEWYQSNNRDVFSATMIYGADPYSGEGMYCRDLAKILVSGVCKCEDWECVDTKARCRGIYEKYRDSKSLEFLKYRSSRYYFCNDWIDILLAIFSTHGCILMLPVYENWDYCPDGILGKNYGSFRGYHFVCALDYRKKSNGAYRVRFKNSWGPSWGSGGYGYIDTDVNGFEEAFALVDDVEEVKDMLFKDVDENKWYSKSIEKVVKAGYMNGDSPDTFRPEDPVTRAELAQVICNLKNL